jgi:hypothetical protein
MTEKSESVPMEQQEMVLPPVFEQFLSSLRADRKKLLKDKSFSDPNQLRSFVGQYLYPRFEEMFRTLAQAFMESYGLSASNANEMRRMYHFTVGELQRLGSDVDHSTRLPGVSPEVLNDFQQAFYGLGTLLQEKYPEDTEAEAAFNRCAELVSEMVAELMDGSDYDDDEHDDDGHDDEEGEDKAEDDEGKPAEAPAEAAAETPAEEAPVEGSDA